MPMIQEASLETVGADVLELVREHLPILAAQIRKAGGESKRRGSVVITISMIDDPGNEKRAARTDLVVQGKTTLPVEVLDSHKVAWEGDQMSLL